MRNESHTSLIGTIRAAVAEWRKREGWSRETVVQVIVDAHEQLNGPQSTGIVFDPNTRDTFDRMKVNADRVFRWLDDEGKDTNLLPANFIQSILGAMPMDVRLHCLDAMLRPIGVVVSSSESPSHGDFDSSTHLHAMIKEGAEAQLALVNVKPGASLSTLENARKEVLDVQESTIRAARALDSAIATTKSSVTKLSSRG